MRKLVFFVIGLFALFTLIKAYTSVRAAEDTTPPPYGAAVSTIPLLPANGSSAQAQNAGLPASVPLKVTK
ncbi:MAG TPA: hypothetical protein VMV68_10585 [Spirochaetia bacterium]|nr:hypothetical protein [Spirochaetia bacterium]